MKGGGCNRYLGNARIDPASFSVGLPLVPVSLLEPSLMLAAAWLTLVLTAILVQVLGPSLGVMISASANCYTNASDIGAI